MSAVDQPVRDLSFPPVVIEASLMKISMANALGTCFGVQDAIDAALDEAFRGNLTIVGSLVDNEEVLSNLREHGIQLVSGPDDEISTPNVMITAHGAPASLRKSLEARGLTVYDASCPLVLRVHSSVRKLVREGFYPLVVGEADHVEVTGIVGDLEEFRIVSSEADLEGLGGYPRLGVVAQTTEPIENVEALVGALRSRYPDSEVRFLDTVCQPSKERQDAVRALAEEVEIMIVVGGANCSHTRGLKGVCDDRGVVAHHIQGPHQLRPEWFHEKSHVGITAGTSTPHDLVDRVRDAVVEMTATSHH